MDTPIFDATFRALHPRERRRHRWDGPAQPLPARSSTHSHALDSRTEEMPVGRHSDDDNDSVVNQADPDWTPPDERDEHALGDEACDPEQEQGERWIGVTRDPDLLEEMARDA